MLTLPKTKLVELSVLTDEIKIVVPALDGLEDEGTTVIVRRLSGTFSAVEATAIQQIFDAHDAAAIRQARATKETRRVAELTKDPKTLSDKERLTRLEVILGVD